MEIAARHARQIVHHFLKISLETFKSRWIQGHARLEKALVRLDCFKGRVEEGARRRCSTVKSRGVRYCDRNLQKIVPRVLHRLVERRCENQEVYEVPAEVDRHE